MGDSVHGLLVMLKDPYQADEVRRELLQIARRPNFNITTWMEENKTMLGALVVEKNVMFYLLFFIVLVAALCILSAQITFVVQKTREIGMLKALGATNLQISGIFFCKAPSSASSAFWPVLAWEFWRSPIATNFLHFMRRMTGWQLFPESIYHFQRIAGNHRRHGRRHHLRMLVYHLHSGRRAARDGAPDD